MAAFTDQAVIVIRAGRGGDGAVSFRTEKYVPRGGPDGGDGGRGGDVVLICDPRPSTLSEFRHRKMLAAEAGRPGSGSNRSGKGGDSIRAMVPPGTVVVDDDTGQIIGDLTEVGQELVVGRGGKGGRGNARFKSATNRAPRRYEPGRPGDERRLRLELKLLADVGLVGLPNAGKSTLLSRVSSARPKVADYPFTTLEPWLGVVDVGDDSFVMADLPGLIEGAHAGLGLGHEFLRHVERTRVLVHVVDLMPIDESDPARNFGLINDELMKYEKDLMERVQIVVGNKLDITGAEESLVNLRRAIGNEHVVLGISGVTGEGLGELLSVVMEELCKARDKRCGQEKPL